VPRPDDIGTNFGDDACQEWLSEKQLVLQEPTYPDSVLARHAVREKAVMDMLDYTAYGGEYSGAFSFSSENLNNLRVCRVFASEEFAECSS